MHICLVIDLLTAGFLIHGIFQSDTRLRQQLCLACLIFLGFIGLRTYINLAEYFGIFERYPSLATRGLDVLLRFFGGFWMLFGVLVLARGVCWVAFAFAVHAVLRWYKRSRSDLTARSLKIAPPLPSTHLQSPSAPD